MARRLRIGKHSFELGRRTLIMGVLNVTPDSFSGDGIYDDPRRAVSRAAEMIRDGADIIDIGGESTRPGSDPVGIEEELRRILPPVKSLLGENIPVSVDTYKTEVATKVLDLGADMINDVTGLRDSGVATAVAEHDAGVVIMHMKGKPKTMQDNPSYPNGVVVEIKDFLGSQIAKAEEAGIRSDGIIIDPGIGFGKTVDHNLEIIRNLSSFGELRKPILIGPSRKSFLGKLLNVPDNTRLGGTIAAVVVSILNGADIVRVHDVPECRRAVAVADAVSRGRMTS
jgi:dihydropteroate synthase